MVNKKYEISYLINIYKIFIIALFLYTFTEQGISSYIQADDERIEKYLKCYCSILMELIRNKFILYYKDILIQFSSYRVTSALAGDAILHQILYFISYSLQSHNIITCHFHNRNLISFKHTIQLHNINYFTYRSTNC